MYFACREAYSLKNILPLPNPPTPPPLRHVWPTFHVSSCTLTQFKIVPVIHPSTLFHSSLVMKYSKMGMGYNACLSDVIKNLFTKCLHNPTPLRISPSQTPSPTARIFAPLQTQWLLRTSLRCPPRWLRWQGATTRDHHSPHEMWIARCTAQLRGLLRWQAGNPRGRKSAIATRS